MNELTMSRTDKYTHTIVEYHSIDGMQLNIEHYVDKQSRQCYVIRIGPLWTCIQYVQRNVEHITLRKKNSIGSTGEQRVDGIKGLNDCLIKEHRF